MMMLKCWRFAFDQRKLTFMRKHFILTLVAALGLAMLSAGCNTLRGVGKDIEKGGEALQKAGD